MSPEAPWSLRGFAGADGEFGAGGASGNDERHATVDLGSDGREQGLPLAIGERVTFTGVAEEAEAVGAGLQEIVDEAGLGVKVERPVFMEGSY